MFTGYDNPADKKVVAELGGKVTEDTQECAGSFFLHAYIYLAATLQHLLAVLVTDKVRRTAKFMCMVAKGVPIVGPGWLSQSKETKTFQGKSLQRQFVL